MQLGNNVRSLLYLEDTAAIARNVLLPSLIDKVFKGDSERGYLKEIKNAI
jgi:hypothetical protein